MALKPVLYIFSNLVGWLSYRVSNVREQEAEHRSPVGIFQLIYNPIRIHTYLIIPKINPGLIFGQSSFLGLFSRRLIFGGGLIFGMKFALEKGVDLLLRGIFLQQ